MAAAEKSNATKNATAGRGLVAAAGAADVADVAVVGVGGNRPAAIRFQPNAYSIGRYARLACKLPCER